MKRFLTSTTALSLVLTPLGTNPAIAQILSENGSVLAVDGTVLCDASGGAACDPALYAEQAAAIEARLADEAAAAEQQRLADEAAAAEQQRLADEAAAAEQQRLADEAAAAEQQRLADEAAAAEQQRLADEAAAAEQQRLADEAAAAEQQRLADEAAAVEQQRLADEAAAVEQQRLADEAAATAATPEAKPEPEAATTETVQPDVKIEPETTVEQVPTPEPVVPETVETTVETTVQPEPILAETTPAEPELPAEILLPETPVVDPAAGLVQAEPVDLTQITPVEVVAPETAQVEALSEILVEPTDLGTPAPLAASSAVVAVETPVLSEGSTAEPIDIVPLSEVPVADDATVVIQTLTEDNVRTSSQEFAAAPVTLSDGRRSGLTAFETVGLIALGALVVGAVINEGRKEERRVVSNTGDRVVVLRPDGTYQVYKDDDTVLRRPGSTVRTETFNDGSTRTIVQRVDGSQIVTIRDASGRVLRRAQYDRFGRELVLIDDFQPEEPVIIRDLPRPKKDRVVISTKDEDAALKARMAALEAKKAKRGFSLRQIREIPEVRDLAAQIDVKSITFDSGSAAITAAEAENLADLGQLMQELLDANPGEMFLIEGHTDAVGHPALNLALSDRRAESVALALAEYFDIPPENLIVQGYGESELLIDSQRDERANRRVLVRVITPLLNRKGG